MSFDPYGVDRGHSYAEEQYPLDLYMSNTFLWMFLGLMITFGVAILCWMTGITVFTVSAGAQTIILILQLVVVIVMGARVEKLSVGTAKGCFLLYSLLTGLTISVYLYLFDLMSMVFIFLATAVFFAVLGCYGRMSGNLEGIRPVLVGGLILLIVYGILSWVIPGLRGFDRLMSLVGIAVFLGFTAYDVRMIQNYYYYYRGYPDMLEKASIFAALQLYLDFINLFLYLLRFMGKRKD